MNFQSGGKSEIRNTITDPRNLPKGNESSAIRNIKPGLLASRAVTGIDQSWNHAWEMCCFRL